MVVFPTNDAKTQNSKSKDLTFLTKVNSTWTIDLM